MEGIGGEERSCHGHDQVWAEIYACDIGAEVDQIMHIVWKVKTHSM